MIYNQGSLSINRVQFIYNQGSVNLVVGFTFDCKLLIWLMNQTL